MSTNCNLIIIIWCQKSLRTHVTNNWNTTTWRLLIQYPMLLAAYFTVKFSQTKFYNNMSLIIWHGLQQNFRKSYIIFVNVINNDSLFVILLFLKQSNLKLMANNLLLSCCEYKSSNSFKIFLILELLHLNKFTHLLWWVVSKVD